MNFPTTKTLTFYICNRIKTEVKNLRAENFLFTPAYFMKHKNEYF